MDLFRFMRTQSKGDTNQSHQSSSYNTSNIKQQIRKTKSSKSNQPSARRSRSKSKSSGTRAMRQNKVYCKACYDKGNVCIEVSEDNIPNHYTSEQKFYVKYKRSSRKKELKKRYP